MEKTGEFLALNSSVPKFWKVLKKFSTKRIILDNYLNTKTSSYIFNSANKKNTIIGIDNFNTYSRKDIKKLRIKK